MGVPWLETLVNPLRRRMDLPLGKLRNLAKRVAYGVLANPMRLRSRLDRLASSGAVIVLNLHRVAPDDGSDYAPMRPALFKELLAFCVRHFDLRTFGEIEESAKRPRMILSFDDGYADFVRYAMPLLDKHRIRVNQNIIPQCVESGRPPLNVAAQDFVGQAPRSLLDSLDVPGFDAPRDRNFGHRLSLFLKHRPQSEVDALADHLWPQFERFADFAPAKVMTVAEVKEAASCHELGAHSFAHSSMAFETDDFLRRDVGLCRDWFRDRLGMPMDIYAFPNGSHRDGQIRIVQEEGVRHVLLVDENFSTEAGIHRRFTFGPLESAEMRVKAVGGRARVPN